MIQDQDRPPEYAPPNYLFEAFDVWEDSNPENEDLLGVGTNYYNKKKKKGKKYGSSNSRKTKVLFLCTQILSILGTFTLSMYLLHTIVSHAITKSGTGMQTLPAQSNSSLRSAGQYEQHETSKKMTGKYPLIQIAHNHQQEEVNKYRTITGAVFDNEEQTKEIASHTNNETSTTPPNTNESSSTTSPKEESSTKSAEVNTALADAELDMEITKEIQIEQDEQKLLSNNTFSNIKEKIRNDVSNLVHSILKKDPSKYDGINEEVVNEKIKSIQDEAIFTLETKELDKFEKDVDNLVNVKEAEVEKLIGIKEKDENEMKAILEDIEFLKNVAEEDIKEEVDEVEQEVEKDFEKDAKDVEKEVIRNRLGVIVTDADFEEDDVEKSNDLSEKEKSDETQVKSDNKNSMKKEVDEESNNDDRAADDVEEDEWDLDDMEESVKENKEQNTKLDKDVTNNKINSNGDNNYDTNEDEELSENLFESLPVDTNDTISLNELIEAEQEEGGDVSSENGSAIESSNTKTNAGSSNTQGTSKVDETTTSKKENSGYRKRISKVNDDECQSYDENESRKSQFKGVFWKKINRFNANNPFSFALLEKDDLLSRSITDGSFEQDKIWHFNHIFRKYGEEYNKTLSELKLIDIGASIGWFTFNMAALGINVLTFEPMDKNADMILRSLCMKENIESGVSGRISFFNIGLGEKDDTCFILSHDDNVGNGEVECIENEKNLQALWPDHSVHGTINMKRLDDLISKEERKDVVAVKMSLNGWEHNVLKGGKEVLLQSKVPMIMTEFCPESIKKHGGDPNKFIKSLYDAGYVWLDVDKKTYKSREEALSFGDDDEMEEVAFVYKRD